MTQAPLALPLREPPRGSLWPSDVLERSGLEMLRSFVEGNLPDPPVTKLTGLRLSEAGLGMASAAMPASPWWQSGAGVFLAGAIAFVADLPLSSTVLTSAPSGTLVTSSQLAISYQRPATISSQTLIGRARLINSTRSLGLAEAIIEDGRGRLLGHATSRCVLMGVDRAALPSRPSPALASSQLPDPFLRDVQGDVLGQEFWDTTAGIEVARRIADGGIRPPVSLLLDWRGADAREGEFTMAMPASPWLCNAFGIVYGGVLAAFADVAMTLAVGSTVPAATAYSALDMTVHFLRPALPGNGDLVARSRVVHRGRTIAVASCEIVDSQEKLVVRASGSTLILPGRSWTRPVNVAEEMVREEG